MRFKPVVFATAAALGVSGCASDPAFWEGVAMGLNATAAQLEAETRNCYWGPPRDQPLGTVRQWCPGDYGYSPVLPVTCLPRDRNCDGYIDRRRDYDRDDRRRPRGKDRYD